MYDPFIPQRPDHIRATPVPDPARGNMPNAINPGNVMPALAERRQHIQPPQVGEPGFQPPPQWADQWAQYNSPEFQQTLMQSPYFQRRDARNDRQQLRQDQRDLRHPPNALGPIAPPQTNPALPTQPLPPQAAPQGDPYSQYRQYPQYGKLWG